MMNTSIIFAIFLIAQVAAYVPSPSRRAFFGKTTGAVAAVVSIVAPSAALAAPEALRSCKAGANNCQTGSLRPSAPMKKADMAAAVEKVLASYPQSGIDTIDLGGNKFVDNDLANAGYAKMEFYSGIGKFAKFFNGGKPFVDDLEVLVGDNRVDFFSSSRVGDSDFGVNSKRVAYIKSQLGWS